MLDKLPKRLREEAKQKLHDIWMADTKQHAHEAFDLFVKTYEAKYPKAVECLAKDREALLTFYDFPAEHWIHLRTTNPIESTFATVRLRTKRTKGCGSRMACLTMVYKLMQSASKKWRLLNGSRADPRSPPRNVFHRWNQSPRSRRLKNSRTQLLTISLRVRLAICF